jgi:lipopolysaccharide biosynthesis regulator YciM
MNNTTVSNKTFTKMLGLVRWSITVCNNNRENAQRQLAKYPGDKDWTKAVEFWTEEGKDAANTYSQAIAESKTNEG